MFFFNPHFISADDFHFPSNSVINFGQLWFFSLTQNMYELLSIQDFISASATDMYSRLPDLTATNLLKAYFKNLALNFTAAS